MKAPAPPLYDEQAVLNELLFVLHQRAQPTLAFLECGSLAKRNELEATLREQLPEYRFHTIDVTPFPVVSLLRTLSEELPTEVSKSRPVTWAVNVHGLENSLLVSEEGQLVPSRMVLQLNLERELLFRNVPYLILLWGDAYFFRTMQREAPDLWHWVTYKFRFEDHTARPVEDLPPLPPERLPEPGDIGVRQERIRELQERYEHLRLDGSDLKRLLKDKINILSLLAQELAAAFRYAEAAEAYEKAAALQETLHEGDYARSKLLFDLAGVYQEQQRLALALATYRRCQEFTAEHNMGSVLDHIGRVYYLQREWELALDSLQQALTWDLERQEQVDTYYRPHYIQNIVKHYHQIGMVYAEKKQWAQALENYRQALEWKQHSKSPDDLGATYHQIGRVYEEQGQWAEALSNYQQALRWKEQTGNTFELGDTYHQIGMVYEAQRQWSEALANYQQALKWYEQTGNTFALGVTYHQIGRVYEEQEIFPEAQDWFEKAVFNLTEFNHADLPVAQASLARVRKPPAVSPEEQG